MTIVEDDFRSYAKAPTNYLYTCKQFQGISMACVRINVYTLVVGNLKETVHLEETHVDG